MAYKVIDWQEELTPFSFSPVKNMRHPSSSVITAIDELDRLEELQALVSMAREQINGYAHLDSPLRRIDILLESYELQAIICFEQSRAALREAISD